MDSSNITFLLGGAIYVNLREGEDLEYYMGDHNISPSWMLNRNLVVSFAIFTKLNHLGPCAALTYSTNILPLSLSLSPYIYYMYHLCMCSISFFKILKTAFKSTTLLAPAMEIAKGAAEPSPAS